MSVYSLILSTQAQNDLLFAAESPPPIKRARPGAGHGAVGVDEAGCGALAGPVVAAAVLLGKDAVDGLDDSKRLSPARRRRVCRALMDGAAAFAVGLATPAEIDELNILQARLAAMRRAIESLRLPASIQVLVDGVHTPDIVQPARAVVGGDASVAAIGAASILAKVYRDSLMESLHGKFPQYSFNAHKGYPTPAHKQALRRHGLSPEHRRSYAPCRLCIESGRSTPAESARIQG